VARTNEAFAVTAQRAAKAEEMVAEIAAASREQAGGLAQLNSAVADMDQVVQQNAAGAEELAGVAEELTAEAAQMRGIINGLLTMVEGRQGAGETQPGARQEQGLRLAPAADETAGQPRLPLVATGRA
jgi:methyl-accepting chemotaxis protein